MNAEKEKIITDLQALIAIDSVETTPKPNMPFGEGIYKALDFSLKLASSMGFQTINYDNYVGEIIWGEGEELAILCHLDVVPTGDNSKWSYPPFSATINGGYMYGRGTVDDKGPFIATLYALKRLKDEGFTPKKQIRLILGCDEESGWACIKHYESIRPLPETGFSPDACFPVIYAEKGIYQIKYFFNYDSNKLFSINGGVAPNVVCDLVKFNAEKNPSLIKKYALIEKQGMLLSVGKTAHASEPNFGKNAVYPVLEYLADIGAIERDICDFFINDILSLREICDETGHLTHSADIIEIDKGKISITLDVRYPSTASFLDIKSKLDKVGEFEVLSHQKPLYNDPNSTLIQTLLSVYEKHSNKKCQPIAIGGGTYARALKLGAGFGPESLDEPSPAHQPDEKISLEKLFKLVDIYCDAILNLCK